MVERVGGIMVGESEEYHLEEFYGTDSSVTVTREKYTSKKGGKKDKDEMR